MIFLVDDVIWGMPKQKKIVQKETIVEFLKVSYKKLHKNSIKRISFTHIQKVHLHD